MSDVDMYDSYTADVMANPDYDIEGIPVPDSVGGD
jgi:hypothetical protein